MIYYSTGNQNKFEEAEIVLGKDKICKYTVGNLQEIQSMSLQEIALKKAIDSYDNRFKTSGVQPVSASPVIAEDIGLFVDSLNGFPGPLVKWINETMGYEKFAELFNKEPATWGVSMAYYNGNNTHGVTNSLPGIITYPPRGESWGFESIFSPLALPSKTVAEMTIDEKQVYSPRFLALKALKVAVPGL